MHDEIVAKLRAIERDDNVRILYAVELGSRVWGFASPNSDWDIRFLYVRPREAYLQLDLPRDVIEIMDHVQDLDFAGWDLFKAMRLLRKSNPPLIEWLSSPIVYWDGGPFVEQLRAIIAEYHTPAAIFGHYLNMVRDILA